MVDEVKEVRTESSAFENRSVSEAVVVLRQQKIYCTGLAVTMLLGMIICAWVYFSPRPPGGQQTFDANFLLSEAKAVDVRRKDNPPAKEGPITQDNGTIVIDPFAYNDAGYQCSVNYDGVTQMRRMQYCKHFGLPRKGFLSWFYYHEEHFGKYFVGEKDCYIIDETEENPGLRPDPSFISFLNLRRERILYFYVYEDSKFIDVSDYHAGAKCLAQKYIHDQKLILRDEKGADFLLSDFLIARAVVWSEECQRMQLIPALYSEQVRRCFYGDGVGKPIKAAIKCHVLCAFWNKLSDKNVFVDSFVSK